MLYLERQNSTCIVCSLLRTRLWLWPLWGSNIWHVSTLHNLRAILISILCSALRVYSSSQYFGKFIWSERERELFSFFMQIWLYSSPKLLQYVLTRQTFFCLCRNIWICLALAHTYEVQVARHTRSRYVGNKGHRRSHYRIHIVRWQKNSVS